MNDGLVALVTDIVNEIWRAGGGSRFRPTSATLRPDSHTVITDFIDLSLRGDGRSLPRLRIDEGHLPT